MSHLSKASVRESLAFTAQNANIRRVLISGGPSWQRGHIEGNLVSTDISIKQGMRYLRRGSG